MLDKETNEVDSRDRGLRKSESKTKDDFHYNHYDKYQEKKGCRRR